MNWTKEGYHVSRQVKWEHLKAIHPRYRQATRAEGLTPVERAVEDLAHRGGRPAAWAGPARAGAGAPVALRCLAMLVKPFPATHSSKIRRMMGASAAFDSVNLVWSLLML
jgi:hypothetical protein